MRQARILNVVLCGAVVSWIAGWIAGCGGGGEQRVEDAGSDYRSDTAPGDGAPSDVPADAPRDMPADGACGRSGMFGIEVTTDAGDRYAIRRTAIDQAELRTPGVPPKPVKLDSPSDAELAIAALGSRGRDPLFARCLSYARQLWSLETDTAASRR